MEAGLVLKELGIISGVSEREGASKLGESNKKVKCFVCRKPGHKAFDCPEREKRGKPKEREAPKQTDKDTKVKATRWAVSDNEGVTLRGSVNGVPCDIVPDTGATVTIVPVKYVPPCQLLDKFELIQGVAGEPVRAQCAQVMFGLDGKQFSLRVVVSDELKTDEVIFAIPLGENEATRLLLGAASEADTSGTGYSGITPDTQAGVKATADSLSLPTSALIHTEPEEQCRVVTRKQARDGELEQARLEEEAQRVAGLLPGSGSGSEGSTKVVRETTPRVGSALERESEGLGTTSVKQRGKGDALSEDRAKPKRTMPSSAGVASKTTPPGGVATSIALSEDRVNGSESESSGSGKGLGPVVVSSHDPHDVKSTPSGQAVAIPSAPSKKGGARKVKCGKVASKTPPPTVVEPKELSGDSEVVKQSEGQVKVGTNAGLTRGVADDSCLQLELPDASVGDEAEGKKALQQRQKDDLGLSNCMLLASSHLRGYEIRDGLLVHVIAGDFGKEILRVVVPEVDRPRILRLAHDHGGHLGVKKTREKLNKLFTWPGIARDVVRYIESCAVCLKVNKSGNKPYKLIERPVVGEPFKSIAVDVVGPLPKGKGGAQYLLTYACMATRWPEAIPLRGVTATEVAEAFCSILCKTGLPDVILTDRGTVFTSKLYVRVAQLFGCERILSAPYYPQGNGVVERFHGGTLKPMLAKASHKGLGWVRFLPLAFFALRQTPHQDSGLSPFDLVYVFNVRGPLDVVYLGWVEDVCEGVAVSKWIETLQDRLQELTDLSVARRKRAKHREE